jgi:hypothetical protein
LTLQPSFPSIFAAVNYAPLPPRLLGTRGFGASLIPDHLRRPTSRPVSFYALFKWWLLLSQHPGCRGNKTSSLTKRCLGALAGDLGCFPFDLGGYPPRSFSRGTSIGIRSLIEAGSLAGPCLHSVALPPIDYITRGYPKRYFEEYQISPRLIRLLLLPTGHDRPFQRSRLADLPKRLSLVHPAHG